MRKFSFFTLLFLLGAGIALSLMVGTLPISFDELISVFQGNASRTHQLIVVDFRIPRMLVALFAGFGLAISGYLFQTIMHNELADPGILGINAGAGLTVLYYLGFFAVSRAAWVLPLIACIGSLLAASLVYFCGHQKGRLAPNRLLLSGIAVNAGISALTLIGTVRASKDSYQFVASWLSGTIWGTTWQHLAILIPWLLFLIPWILIKGKELEVIFLGDEVATSLGIKMKRAQLFFLSAAVCLAAVSVSVAGSISFIGLIAPHIAQIFQRKKNNRNLLMSGMIGGLLLLYSDILGRVILPDGEMAAGIIVSIIGAPYFVYQLLKKE
ncbi:ABC transporter permease [Enterococcus florum]|uniref:ABC transporter permease n=1 Tax=Enterococcus florum TaxID=2480627 RepID=A0A4P5PFP3_9ENTE|nr:iron ABC transporter permease [Enterococcus florum]GCF92303.1 ABC transporter permease [Enterococcus florum]